MIRAVIDSNCLYSSTIRGALLYVAGESAFEPIWSDMIHDEWIQAVLRTKPNVKKSLLNAKAGMDQTFPAARKHARKETIGRLDLPDPDDRHVLALAIDHKCDFLVTNNTKDFPWLTLLQYRIARINPDDFLCELLKSHRDQVLEGIKRFRGDQTKSKPSSEEFVERLSRDGLIRFAGKLGRYGAQI